MIKLAGRDQLKAQLIELETEMHKYLKELGYDAQGSASAVGGRMPGAAGAGGAE